MFTFSYASFLNSAQFLSVDAIIPYVW